MDTKSGYLDPYSTLGLNKDATEDDVKKTYKKLALKYHPDKNSGDDVMFKRINEAYQILIDPVKRKLHDMQNETIDYDALTKFATSLFTIIQEKLQEKLVTKSGTPVSKSSSSHNPQQHQSKSDKTWFLSAKPLRIKVPVCINDLYNGSIKKVVVKVKRRVENEGNTTLEYIRIPLYVSLLHFQHEYTFIGCGDDTLDPNVQRGNVIICLDISTDTNNKIRIDDLFSRFDLQLEEPMSLYEFYYGIDKEIPFLNGEFISVKCLPLTSFIHNRDTPWYFVHEVKDKGLPYHQSDNDNAQGEHDICRGSLFIHFTLQLPLFEEETLGEAQNFFIKYFKDGSPIATR
jgi:DnaJ-class molecular chaperone